MAQQLVVRMMSKLPEDLSYEDLHHDRAIATVDPSGMVLLIQRGSDDVGGYPMHNVAKWWYEEEPARGDE